MARQESLIQLTGPVGNLSFYKSQDGYLVRRKSGVSGDRIKSDPAYARTRENIAEFRRSILGTKLLRTAFRSLIHSAVDNRVSSRLTGAIVRVIQGDAVNPRGQRNVVDGKVALLEGFDFNRNGKLATTFSAPFTASIDRSTGTLSVDIPSFTPDHAISAPEGATHFRLKAGGAAIDFEGNTWSMTTSESADLPIGQQVQGPLQLRQTVTPSSVDPLFFVFGVEFLQSVNGKQYPLNNGAFDAMAIVKVDGYAAGERGGPASAGKENSRVKNPRRTSSNVVMALRDSLLPGILRGSCPSSEVSAKNPRDGPVYNARLNLTPKCRELGEAIPGLK